MMDSRRAIVALESMDTVRESQGSQGRRIENERISD